ncbi:hypothetical protein AAG570_013561 [Ranatra chinensis]|uniref:Nicotinamide riboside kinase 1 n=1 Tax=Ranatra chinensis TaxID=642074 RepID=A0ABD0Z0U3_9HEMI
MFVLGISGVTCSGKTTLARLLKKDWVNCIHLCQDDYFLPEDSPRHVVVPHLGHNNWELITALDMDRMKTDIREVMNSSLKDGVDLLILEGFLLLNDTELSSYCDVKVYVDVPYEECRRRRFSRTYDPPDVPGYFDDVVWPESQKNRKLVLSQFPDLCVLDGSLPVNVLYKMLLEILTEKGFKKAVIH